MRGQSNLFNEPDLNENEAYELILPTLLETLDSSNINHSILSLSRKKGFSSVMLSSLLAFRLCFRGNHSYVSIPTDCLSSIPSGLATIDNEQSNGFSRIPVIPASSIASFHDFFVAVMEYTIDRLPKEFDCCSLYMTCSDAKRCISPRQELALGCGYKKIMRHCRIFYGENRNVDSPDVAMELCSCEVD